MVANSYENLIIKAWPYDFHVFTISIEDAKHQCRPNVLKRAVKPAAAAAPAGVYCICDRTFSLNPTNAFPT
jgi:hypothetical protein